jgi:hypothetical protein
MRAVLELVGCGVRILSNNGIIKDVIRILERLANRRRIRAIDRVPRYGLNN